GPVNFPEGRCNGSVVWMGLRARSNQPLRDEGSELTSKTGDFLGLLLLFSGLGLGLGASTVMDVLGVLGRRSEYWTLRAIATDRVAVPLMWVGVALATAGGILFNRNHGLAGVVLFELVVWITLVLNGAFLTFHVIPRVYPIEHRPEGQ